jgi:ribonuclease P protein subunit RPR2
MGRRNNDKSFLKRTTAESIDILLDQAGENLEKHPDRTKKYVRMVWDLVKKYKIRLSPEQKNKFCRKCLAFFELGKNSKVTFNSKNNSLCLICLDCNHKRIISKISKE